MGSPSFDDNGDKMPQWMRWTKRCAYCQNEFKANRDDAQTCSPAHRIALHRREKRKRIAAAAVGQTGVEATPPQPRTSSVCEKRLTRSCPPSPRTTTTSHSCVSAWGKPGRRSRRPRRGHWPPPKPSRVHGRPSRNTNDVLVSRYAAGPRICADGRYKFAVRYTLAHRTGLEPRCPLKGNTRGILLLHVLECHGPRIPEEFVQMASHAS